VSREETEALRAALAEARSDLLAYGFHLDGQWINKGGNPATHRKPGEPCRCGLDAAVARASAALGYVPQSERERAALAHHPHQPADRGAAE
jgi:hypothetical protein